MDTYISQSKLSNKCIVLMLESGEYTFKEIAQCKFMNPVELKSLISKLENKINNIKL